MLGNCLFSTKLEHPYYEDGIWHEIQIRPDVATADFIQRYQLVMRTGEGYFGLYYYGPNKPERFIASSQDLLQGKPLVFDVISENPYWLNLAGLPVDWSGQLDFTCSSESESGAESESDLSSVNPSQPNQLTVTLSQRNVTNNSTIGQISIYSHDYLTSMGAPSQPQFQLVMPARFSQWRYFVCNASNLILHTLTITNAEGIEFEQPKAVLLPDGRKAQMFSSGQQQFKLQQSFKVPFQLFNLEDGADSQAQIGLSKPVIKALPIPRQDVLEIERNSGVSTVYSPMYVYI